MDIKSKLINLVPFVLVFVLGALTQLGMMYILNSPPNIDIKYVHQQVLNTPAITRESITSETEYIKGHRDLFIYAEFCIDKSINSGRYTTILRIEESNSSVTLNTKNFSINEGCYNTSLPVIVPGSLPPGDYTLETRISGGEHMFNSFHIAFLEVPLKLK